MQDQGKAAASAAGSDAGGQEEEDDDEAAMAAMLGFGGFGSSKVGGARAFLRVQDETDQVAPVQGKQIEGNADIGASKTNQPRVIRQYMNRQVHPGPVLARLRRYADQEPHASLQSWRVQPTSRPHQVRPAVL